MSMKTGGFTMKANLQVIKVMEELHIANCDQISRLLWKVASVLRQVVLRFGKFTTVQAGLVFPSVW